MYSLDTFNKHETSLYDTPGMDYSDKYNHFYKHISLHIRRMLT